MNVPQLRFKDDDGREFPEWEEKKLKDVGENIIGLTYTPKTITDDKLFPIVLRSSNIKNDTLDLHDQVRVKEKINEKLFVKEDDILICTRNGSQRLIGKNVLITDNKIPMTFGAFMSVFRSPMNKFIVHLFKTDNFNEQIQMNLGARINQITTKNLNSFKFNFPCVQEQTKIANFLTAIDEKITQLTQKHDCLKQYKKGVMQQIFSQKLRFKDDDGREFPEWKNEIIGAHVDFLSGYPFNGDDISENNNGIQLMRGVNITEGMIRHDSDIDKFYCGETKKLEKYFLELNDLVIGMDGSKVGKNSALIKNRDVNSLLVQRVARLRAKATTSIFFIFQYVNSIFFHSYVDKVKTSSGIPHISAKQIKEFRVGFPCLAEQTKIANFLTAIDDKITHIHTQLEVVKQYKKGLLQQMFV